MKQPLWISVLRALALLCAVTTLGLWLGLGGNSGWTKTSVPVVKKDPVTDLEYQEFERRFAPGLDFVAAGLLSALVPLGVTWVLGRMQPRRPRQEPGHRPRERSA